MNRISHQGPPSSVRVGAVVAAVRPLFWLAGAIWLALNVSTARSDLLKQRHAAPTARQVHTADVAIAVILVVFVVLAGLYPWLARQLTKGSSRAARGLIVISGLLLTNGAVPRSLPLPQGPSCLRDDRRRIGPHHRDQPPLAV